MFFSTRNQAFEHNSSLEVLCEEVLGMTKMNWNNPVSNQNAEENFFKPKIFMQSDFSC